MIATAADLVKAQKRTVLLIGASGLIGGTIAHYFRTRAANEIELLAPCSKILSIRHAEEIKRYLRMNIVDCIINCAIAAVNSDAQLAFEVNYLGALNLARAACTLGIPYIHMGSAAVLPDGDNLTEEIRGELIPDLSDYAKSKMMVEESLDFMGRLYGLDYTNVRLAIVYGEHDHKIQGFHRLLFSIAEGSMPFMFTSKKIFHSYTNAEKLPYFIHHILNNRQEFTQQTYHFVDQDPVELARLILTIRSHMALKRPRELYIPFPLVHRCANIIEILAILLKGLGITVRLPGELMFLESCYKKQTLSNERLQRSSFVDPFPEKNIFSELPKLLIYYLTRWGNLKLINTFSEEECFDQSELRSDFLHSPRGLLSSVHTDSAHPFTDLTPTPTKAHIVDMVATHGSPLPVSDQQSLAHSNYPVRARPPNEMELRPDVVLSRA